MDYITPFFVFILVWWTVIFAVLPFGNAPVDKPIIGHAASAPANPRLKKKFIWTTAISLVITVAILLAMRYGGFSIHNMVKSWSLE